MRLEVGNGLDTVGSDWDPIFAAGPGIQSRRLWFAATEAAALPEGARALTLALHDRSGPAALLPLVQPDGRTPHLTSMTSPYTVLFQPLLADRTDFHTASQAFGRHLRSYAITTFEALDPAWTGLAPFLAGFRQAGLVPARFDQFGNWHEPLAGRDWAGYLAARPGALRETIRRKGKLATRDPAIRFEIARTPEELAPALQAYEAVYVRSWKVPEPFPHYNAALLQRLATAGAMRLGVMWQGDVPLAAQYWTVERGIATVLKLAHDDAARALSPGTLLTAHMIRLLIEEGATELDFGRGDDPYKQQWTTLRRPRIGVLLANPRHPAGLAALARHGAGLLRRRLRGLRG